MKHLKLHISIFIVAYLVFMLAGLPASMVLGMVKLPPGTKLGEVSGTAWQGQVTAVQYKQDVFTDVKWDLSPLSLLTGRIGADVKFGKMRDQGGLSGEGFVSSNFAMDNFSAQDFTLRMPASDLVGRMQMNLPAQLSGRIILKLKDYDQGKPYCEQLTGDVKWLKAQLNMGSNVSLGSLEGDLACKQGEVELKISKANPLGLQVTSLIGDNNKFTVKGFVKPDGTMPNEVHQAVKMFGQADSQGRYPIEF